MFSKVSGFNIVGGGMGDYILIRLIQTTDSLIQTKCKVFSSLLFSTTVQDSLVAVLHLLYSEMKKTNTPKKCSLRPHKINI